MERGAILLVAIAMIYVTPAVHGTSHLSLSNDTEVNITRDGCGTTKLCVETPDNCNPAEMSMSMECLFVSLKVTAREAPSRNDLTVELAGNSSVYIAVGLTANPSEGTTLIFACAQVDGTLDFRTLERNNNNNMISNTERTVNEIRGMVNGSLIKCIFNVPAVNATETRAADSIFNVLIGELTFNGTLGTFNVRLDGGSLNIADPNATAMLPTPDPNSNMTTTMTGTTASCGAVHPHAVLLLLSVLSLSIMLGA